MKSIQEFNNETEYREYLRFYYAGLTLQSLTPINNDNKKTVQGNAVKTAQDAVVYADELLKILIPVK